MSNYNLFNASSKELYTLILSEYIYTLKTLHINTLIVLSVYLVRLSQLYQYNYCTYKIRPKENQPNSIVVRAVLSVVTT